MASLTALRDASATELRAFIEQGTVTPSELIGETFAEIDRSEPSLSAFIALRREDAVADAHRMADAHRIANAHRMVAGRSGRVPPLFGLPFTVKDTIEVAGMAATAGSALLTDYRPASTAQVVGRIERAGAILVGKTNCAEFGIGNLETWSTVGGQTRNPWNLSRSAGGSSGGDSAAVASGMSSFGVGTDYGGSVRFPAHCTGIAALRPTPGRVPGDGMLPQRSERTRAAHPSHLQRELQTAGFLARSVNDLTVLLRVTGDYWHDFAAPTRCAWFVDDVDADVEHVVESAAAALVAAGLEVAAIDPLDVAGAARLLAERRDAEGVPEIEWLSRGRRELLSPLVREQVERPVLAARAELDADIERMRTRVRTLLDSWQLLLMPVAATSAFAIETEPIETEPIETQPIADARPDRSRLDLCTRMVTLMRLPAVVVPFGTSRDGMPIGVQIAAREGCDEQALAAARILETAYGRWRPQQEAR